MNEFIRLIDSSTGLPVWVRRGSIVRFSVYNGVTTVVLAGTNDQDNHVFAEGDLTEELTRGE